MESSRHPSSFETIPVIYAGGISGYEGSRSEWSQAFIRREVWWLGLDETQVRVWHAAGSMDDERELVRSKPWDQIKNVSIEEGGTSSNIAALATFGIGLGARKRWSVVTVACPDETAVFVIYKPLHQLRPLRDALIRAGVPVQKLTFGSDPQAQAASQPESITVKLERLAALYREGLLTEDQYTSAKKKVINR